MKTLDETIYLQALYDHYGVLLTKKQQAYFEAYYNKDYSITELSENNDVSRNAVFDQLKRVEKKLHDYERKLQLLKKSNKRDEIIKNILKEDLDEALKANLEKLLEIE
jgi:predicted DNA-binding protein YlxM (UPF0122 family)